MEPKKPSPPAIFIRFFRWFCHPDLKRYIEGDLLELYDERLKTAGEKRANVQFVVDVLLLFRPGIIRPVKGYQPVNNYTMFKSYFKIGWRNLLRSKGYSFINIGGLALGMMVAMLIGLWVYDELSYDRNFKNYDRIARVMQNQVFDGKIQTWGNQALQLGPELRNAYGSNFDHVIMSSGRWDHKLIYEDKRIVASGEFMEAAVTDMLSLKMIGGTASGLKELHSILLSRSTAKALFGNENAVNKAIRIDDKLDVKVTGIYEDLPGNSSFSSLHIIMPWELLVQSQDLEKRVTWGNSWFQCFVQIAPNTDMAGVSQNIRDAKLKRVLAEDDDARFKPELFLHPMSRWHLHSDFENGISTGGPIQYVWMFGTVGAFVLLLACINFMNLSTARSERRAKEVGIRKTIGSVRAQLVNQFFTESLLVAFLAFAFALVMVQLALPWFNEVSGKHIAILWSAPEFWIACITFALATGIIAGSYPALYLSSFQAVKVLKGTFRAGRFAAIPRKVLVVVQFTVSITLIVGTIIVFKQIQFAQSRPVGYSQDGLISIPIKTNEIMKHYDVLLDELSKTNAVENVAASESSITETWTTNSGFQWAGKDPNTTEEFVTVGITHDFGKTIGWKVKEGRDFSIAMATDSSGFIINEAAAEYLGFKNPIGETLQWGQNGNWQIIGVVKDMITQSPYAPVKPMLFFLKSTSLDFIQFSQLNIRLSPSVAVTEGISRIEPVIKKYDPDNDFEYRFADQEFGNKFKNEKRVGKLALVFASLAILISCLGLFGLASFTAEQRTKEIGIRKILGASVGQLWQMLSRDFVLLVFIAVALATPISFYFMSSWLMQYAYRIEISWHIFATACICALAITIVTISYQSLRAATMNPVKSLRSE